MLDLTLDYVEIEIRQDGKVVWIHTNDDPVAVVRICQINDLTVVDHRSAGKSHI